MYTYSPAYCYNTALINIVNVSVLFIYPNNYLTQRWLIESPTLSNHRNSTTSTFTFQCIFLKTFCIQMISVSAHTCFNVSICSMLYPDVHVYTFTFVMSYTPNQFRSLVTIFKHPIYVLIYGQFKVFASILLTKYWRKLQLYRLFVLIPSPLSAVFCTAIKRLFKPGKRVQSGPYVTY